MQEQATRKQRKPVVHGHWFFWRELAKDAIRAAAERVLILCIAAVAGAVFSACLLVLIVAIKALNHLIH